MLAQQRRPADMSAHLLPQYEPAFPCPETAGTILIIDDDQSMAEVLTCRLGRQGFQTLSAGTGEVGLLLAQLHRPNLVLLDLRLPDADGLWVCQSLSDDPATCDMPVIVVSAVERPDIIRRCRMAGSRYFVRKPYDPNALLVLIRQALAERWPPLV